MPSNIDTKQKDKTRKSKIRFIVGCWLATITIWVFIILNQSGKIPGVATIFKNAPPELIINLSYWALIALIFLPVIGGGIYWLIYLLRPDNGDTDNTKDGK